MISVAKLIMVDENDQYLMLYRSNHPVYGDDPDVPGGTAEPGETLLSAAKREVYEEVGVNVSEMTEIYRGSQYSRSGIVMSLFITQVGVRPKIAISWEHKSYEWLSKDNFTQISKNANDPFMHMVHDVLTLKS